MPIFGFVAIGAGLALVYAGWLGIPPTQVVRDLFTGTPLPARRGILDPKPAGTAAPLSAPSSTGGGATAMPGATSAPIYPQV